MVLSLSIVRGALSGLREDRRYNIVVLERTTMQKN